LTIHETVVKGIVLRSCEGFYDFPVGMSESILTNPDPLATTCREFVAAGLGSPQTYSAIFREGVLVHKRFTAGTPDLVRVHREPSDEGEVIKLVLRVPGVQRPKDSTQPSAPASLPRSLAASPISLETESVLIPMIGRTGVPTYTLCVSSQVGCAMGCVFCETGQMGLMRSLSAGEIVGQWFAAAHQIGIRPKNVVFMGMGEPMDNLDAVLQAIAVLTDHRGPAVPMSKITISTVGRLDGIRRMAEHIATPGWHRLNIALSLNAPNDEIRSRIMPINRKTPMLELREALLAWPRCGQSAFCVEYVLIPGVNDARKHAEQVAEWARPLPACINVIPYNPRRNSPWPAPDEASVEAFLGWLTQAGAYAKRRRTKGRAMMGACGQLGNEQIRKRQWVVPTVEST
jgi:23S rRNA (adenine2503-C2)-methyltransferase